MTMRTVVRSDSFDATASQLFQGDIRQADSALNAFEYELSRKDDFSFYPLVVVSDRWGRVYARKIVQFGRSLVLLFSPFESHEIIFHTIYEGDPIEAPTMFPHG